MQVVLDRLEHPWNRPTSPKNPPAFYTGSQGLGHSEACAVEATGLSYALRLVSRWRRGACNTAMDPGQSRESATGVDPIWE